jgi:hypothetical protein
MRPLMVKFLAPQIQTSLITSAQGLELQTDIAMQTLMGSIVLGMSRATSFQLDS